MFKDLLVLLDPANEAIGPYATSFAAALGCRLVASAPLRDIDLAPYMIAEAPVDAWMAQRAEARKQMQDTLDAFVHSAWSKGVQAEALILDTSLGTPTARTCGLMARYFDMTLVEQAQPGDPQPQTSMIEAVLFESGRPVLVVPYVQRAPAGFGTVLVAWDGSVAASRAVHDALPLLAKARKVEVATVAASAGWEKPAEHLGLSMTRHLTRHGIAATTVTLTSAGDVANTLLSHMADAGTDLLVMGGYGHSRLREIVLGGTTRAILASMTAPVLMAH